MVSKLAQRLLVFFIGLPIVIGVVCLHYYHHLALHLVIVATSLCAALELHSMFSRSYGIPLQNKGFLTCMVVLMPIAACICTFCLRDGAAIEFVFLGVVMLCMSAEAVTARTFEHSTARLLSSMFIIFYSGYLPTFVSRMTLFDAQKATALISVFLLMVFMCDSLAWLFGNLFGKRNRGIIPASPNKSVAGFFGGFAGSALSGFVGYKVFPAVFAVSGSPARAVALGLLIALSAIMGDLVESVLKRSANCKDSGSLVPGRGGILDSVDSVFFAAPVYYFASSLLF